MVRETVKAWLRERGFVDGEEGSYDGDMGPYVYKDLCEVWLEECQDGADVWDGSWTLIRFSDPDFFVKLEALIK